MKHEKIGPQHLERKAILYVRQSSAHQVLHNRESSALQYAMRDRLSDLGWSRIETVDDDLGRSAAGGVAREGFDRMIADVCLGKVGAVAAREVSRFARNSRDWQHLIEMCRVVDTVLIDQETVYAPRDGNDRLLLGLKGSLNEYLKYYGRLDEGVPVKPSILSAFLKRKSASFQCRLVQHHHAKVIWWREYGLYIGSANLTASAWYKNVEAGCFFPEAEITDEMAEDILELFNVLDRNSTPLTEELLAVMLTRAKKIASSESPFEEFWNSPSFNKWPGLVQTGKKKATDRRRDAFLEEWHSTLQQLRDIGTLVSKPENRPSWVSPDAPAGAQGDQFLHAHYYQRTFDGRRALYAEHFERNKKNSDNALAEAVTWWRSLPKAPWEEDVMLNYTAPMLQEALTAEAIDEMEYQNFREICMGIHSIKDYARRVANKAVDLREDGTKYTIPEKVNALSKRIWDDKSAGGNDVRQLLKFILYGGPEAQLPERLWTAVHDPKWKLEGLGVSALGELVGWALPDRFPPRNGRTSKSLKSLGYDVTVHVG